MGGHRIIESEYHEFVWNRRCSANDRPRPDRGRDVNEHNCEPSEALAMFVQPDQNAEQASASQAWKLDQLHAIVLIDRQNRTFEPGTGNRACLEREYHVVSVAHQPAAKIVYVPRLSDPCVDNFSLVPVITAEEAN